MAKRYIGDAVITIAYRDQGDYAGTIRAGGHTWRFSDLHPAAVGFGPGIGYDSPEAYDEMAGSAVSFASYYSSGNRGDDAPEWAPPEEVADAISEATQWAQDESGKYEVRRSPKRPAREEARASESRRAPSNNRSAYDFFRKNAGGRVGHSAEDAWALAAAEMEAHRRGWHVEWEDDPEGWDSLGDIDPNTVKEVLSAILRDNEGNVLGSLGSIVDPDRNYGRVVEAELALDALSNEGWAPSRQRSGARETPSVADFNTVDDLVAHAKREGATHVLDRVLYYPLGAGQYAESEIWNEGGYWHTQSQSERIVIDGLPASAKPIGGHRQAAEAPRRHSGPQPNAESRARLAGYIAHAIMYDVSTSPHDLVKAYHLSPEEAQAVLSDRGGWFGPGGKGYAAYVKHIEKALKKKEWFSAPDPKAIPGAARGYGRYVWLLENAASGDQGRKDKSDAEDLERELSNVGFNGWGLAIDNWPEAQRYYNAAESVYRRHGGGEARESPIARDYIAVDRNDRRVAGPFRSRGEAEGHVPPGGYVKFSSATRRRAPPPPSSYPMFREGGSRAERLLAAGAKTYTMMPNAIAKVRGFNPSQAIFFAMTSRREDARVADAAIGKSEMDRAARQIGGVVKLGYVVDGVAYVLPKPT